MSSLICFAAYFVFLKLHYLIIKFIWDSKPFSLILLVCIIENRLLIMFIFKIFKFQCEYFTWSRSKRPHNANSESIIKLLLLIKQFWWFKVLIFANWWDILLSTLLVAREFYFRKFSLFISYEQYATLFILS